MVGSSQICRAQLKPSGAEQIKSCTEEVCKLNLTLKVCLHRVKTAAERRLKYKTCGNLLHNLFYGLLLKFVVFRC